MFGLARTGMSVIRALTSAGARVFAWDDQERSRREATASGANLVPFSQWPWDRIRALILSPGVPLTHPTPHGVVTAARKAGVEIIGDLEIFGREIGYSSVNSAPVIAVTGTNGKSTTTALIGHILAACGYTAEVGGNIGKPVLNLSPPGSRTVYILEVSSYQIDLSPGLAPDVSVLTNVAPDHLDRHGSMANYVSAKCRLLEHARRMVCIGINDPNSAYIYARFAGAKVEAAPISIGKVIERGVFVLDGILYDSRRSPSLKIADLKEAKHLVGAHNWQNAALAYAATLELVKDAKSIGAAIASFPGLPHRMEDVGSIRNVRFINDSKATNADAAERALVCFDDIFWIAGGLAKAGGIESLSPQFSRVRKAYLIGDAAPNFAKTLQGVDCELCGDLNVAVAAAYRDARRSRASAPVVLFSPACASFDQFRDYEHRGEVYRALVAELIAPAREAS